MDENDPNHSTRILSAEWINNNIPHGMNICVGTKTLVPYDTPPFDFSNYAINQNECRYTIMVEREIDHVGNPKGVVLVKRFRPRFTLVFFPFVFSHINPQISIYQAKREYS
jgi:hypothetical protein